MAAPTGLTNLKLSVSGTDKLTATATSGAATLNQASGVITSESLTTAAGADYTLTITNNQVVKDSDMVFASVKTGTNTTAGLSVQEVTPAVGSVVIKVKNTHASSALNGTISVSFVKFAG